MKKFLIIALVATLFGSCEKIDWNDGKEIASLTCAPNEIIYKTQYDTPVKLCEDGNFGGANLLSNTYENGVGRLTFDTDIKTIKGAFYGCKSLQYVILPEGLESLSYSSWTWKDGSYTHYEYDGAFEYCENLVTIVLPSTLQGIRTDVFNGCDKLQFVYCKATTPPSYSEDCGLKYRYYDSDLEKYIDAYQNCTIYVPREYVKQYRTTNHWYRHNIVEYDY